MHVRPAQIYDIPQLISLGRQLWELHISFDQEYYQLEENFDDLFGNWLKEQINSPNQFIFVAQDSTGVVVGFIAGFIKALYPWFKTKSVGHVSYLVIDPAFRHIGVGRLLESYAIEWFKSKNISYIEVYVEEKNSVGQNAWSAYGFEQFKKFLRKRI